MFYLWRTYYSLLLLKVLVIYYLAIYVRFVTVGNIYLWEEHCSKQAYRYFKNGKVLEKKSHTFIMWSLDDDRNIENLCWLRWIYRYLDNMDYDCQSKTNIYMIFLHAKPTREHMVFSFTLGVWNILYIGSNAHGYAIHAPNLRNRKVASSYVLFSRLYTVYPSFVNGRGFNLYEIGIKRGKRRFPCMNHRSAFLRHFYLFRAIKEE